MIKISGTNPTYKQTAKWVIASLNREIPKNQVDKWIGTVLSSEQVKTAGSDQINILTLVANYYKKNAPEICEKITNALKISPHFKMR